MDKLFEEVKRIRKDIELIKAIGVFKDLKIGLYFSEENIKNKKLKWELITNRLKTFRKAVAVYNTYILYALEKLFKGLNPEVISESAKVIYAGICRVL